MHVRAYGTYLPEPIRPFIYCCPPHAAPATLGLVSRGAPASARHGSRGVGRGDTQLAGITRQL